MIDKSIHHDQEIPDPTEEMMRIKYELGRRAGFDIHRIAEELREFEQESGRTYVAPAKSNVEPIQASNKS